MILLIIGWAGTMKVIRSQWISEGAGARVLRVLGNGERLDPFIMLDLFRVRLPAGFPDHPHRGFETITYMLSGQFYHEDCHGHRGRIDPGDVQWMTAGRGIIHSEMPASDTEDALGFQLWLNLRGKDKMVPAQYQEYTVGKFPVFEDQTMTLKVLAGKFEGLASPIALKTNVVYYDVSIKPGSSRRFEFNKAFCTMLFVHEGECEVDKTAVKLHEGALFKTGTPEQLEVGTAKGCKFILLSGEPIKEPMAQHGPFVMNSQAQIEQTFKDYQQAKNGFEKRGWSSKISRLADNPRLKLEL